MGDTHGHLQLALCIAARWQQQLDIKFEAVFLCGDVGTFTSESQLDSTTRRHAKTNPCELEFLYQWSAYSQGAWLASIFKSCDQDGLGLECPVVMVHGNHEGFEHLSTLIPQEPSSSPVPILELPVVDTAGALRYLPSGYKCITRLGTIVGGIGGIERGQRQAKYHELAYLDESAILQLLESDPFDVLITHQGPSVLQGGHGSTLLDTLIDANLCRYWFHGHSIPNPEITQVGPKGGTTVVPLGDVAFTKNGVHADDPGEDGWSWLRLGQSGSVCRVRPDFWREFRKSKWKELPNSQLIAPPLAKFMQYNDFR